MNASTGRSSEFTEELQRAFPNIYSAGRRSVMNPEADYRSPSPANSLHRIRRGMQNPNIQAALDSALEQPSTPQQQLPRFSSSPASSSHHNIPLVSPRMSSANPVPSPIPPAVLARGRAGNGIGITRFLAPSQPRRTPATSSHHVPMPYQPQSHATHSANSTPRTTSSEGCPAATSQDRFTVHHSSSSNQRGSQCRYLPYQIPQIQYSRRTTYVPPRLAARSSSSRQRRSQCFGESHSRGRWFTKTVVLVDSNDTNVPRGVRRQQLHEMGAVIDLMDFFTGWREGKVRDTIEGAYGGMIDDEKPAPRYT